MSQQDAVRLGSPSLPLSYCCSNTTLMSHSVVLGDKFLHYCEHTMHFIWTKRLIYNSGLVFVSFTLFYSVYQTKMDWSFVGEKHLDSCKSKGLCTCCQSIRVDTPFTHTLDCGRTLKKTKMHCAETKVLSWIQNQDLLAKMKQG